MLYVNKYIIMILNNKYANKYEVIKCRTFPRPVVDVDGLCRVLALIVLDGHQMGVRLRAEVGREGQHVVVAITQSFVHLKKKK